MKRLEAVIFDWAGTTVDHGSLAPVRAITELFAHHGIRLSDADARRDMGIFKKDHIQRILAMPHVEAAWRERKDDLAQLAGESACPTEQQSRNQTPAGLRPVDRIKSGPQAESLPHQKSSRAAKILVECNTERTVERLFEEFQPLQMEILEAYSQVIAGTVEVTERLRGRGLKVGSTTGYTRPMLDSLLRCAAAQGYRPDAALCPDDTGGGRPHPWMCLRIALEFRLSAAQAAVKVGDTESDIEEGLNAGMWSVGVSTTGNEVGMSAAEWEALRDDERARLAAQACEKLIAAGAHYVVERVALLEPVLEEIDARLAMGERP
jgi:phosphonoacetaldehyde hydrolase